MMRYVIIILILLFCLSGQSQDIHFTQYYASPYLINPAFSGNSKCRLFAGLNYRSQGKSVSVPYVTQSGFIDGRISLGGMQGSWFGVGATFFNDKAGNGDLKTTSAIVHFAFTKAFDPDQNLTASVGFSGGFVNKSVDFAKLTFDNQWNGTSFDPSISSGENFIENSIYYYDLNAGILVNYKLTNEIHTFIGASLQHINNPKITFYESDYRLDWKYVIHGGAFILIQDNISLEPGFMFASQSKTKEVIFGANGFYGLDDMKVGAGIWVRLSGDIVPVAGIEYKDFRLLFSYDVNVSKLSPASKLKGGFEISLVKHFFCTGKRSGRFEKCRNFEYTQLF